MAVTLIVGFVEVTEENIKNTIIMGLEVGISSSELGRLRVRVIP